MTQRYRGQCAAQAAEVKEAPSIAGELDPMRSVSRDAQELTQRSAEMSGCTGRWYLWGMTPGLMT